MANPFAAPVDQLGIVVTDLEAAIAEYLKLGIGPFLVIRDVALSDYKYRDQASKPILDVAFAQKGEVQIELIQQTNDAPSSYRDFIASGGNGFHHFGWFCEPYDAAIAAAADSPVVQSGAWTTFHFVYYDTTSAIQPRAEFSEIGEATGAAVMAASAAGTPKIAELIEVNDMSRAVFKLIRDAAEGWDGKTNPVRGLLSPSGIWHIAEDIISHKFAKWFSR